MSSVKGYATKKGLIPRNFRFSALAARLLDMLSEEDDRTNTGYLEWLLRRQAEAKGWDLKKIAEDIEKEKRAAGE